VILLDTDHLSILIHAGSARAEALATRLRNSPDQPHGPTIISVVEQFRGWSAEINKARDVAQEVRAYGRLSRFVDLLGQIAVFPFDARAADEFERLRQQKLRIGTMDLKIAAIALANNALLLTANRRDFARVPGLRIENWLDESSH
jgi:tRNA(fMet)-specific endonuclease VapC